MTVKNNFLTKTYVHVITIAVLGFLIYSNTFRADFVFDDKIYIIDNPAIKDFSYFLNPFKVLGLRNFTPDFTFAFITRIAGYLTFALNYHLHGLDVTGYHVFNIIVHVINAFLVYALIRLLFRTPFVSEATPGQPSSVLLTPDVFAFCCALVFVSHPVQTQAVTYIVQRWTSLATLLFLLSIAAYVKSRLSHAPPLKYGLYCAALLSATTAMLVKEISFTLPVMIALAELFFFQGKYGKRILLLVPFALTMLILPAVLLTAQGAFSMNAIGQSLNTLASFPHMTRTEYLFTQFRVIATYIRLLFLPVNQNLDYDYPVYHSFFTPPVLFSFLLLLFLVCIGVYFLRRSTDRQVNGRHMLRLTGMGILWFVITLSVESSFMPIKDLIFEHRLYLPSVGFIMAIMGAIAMLVQRFESRSISRVITAAVAVAILVFSISAHARNNVWKTNISLWKDVVRKSPSKARPHNNLGVAYEKEGRTDEAIREYLLAIQINPDYDEAHYNLGVAYEKKGRIKDAVQELLTAIRISPAYGQAHNNLGIIYGRTGRTDEAVREFLRAKQINPDAVNAYNNLGVMYARQGRIEEAIHEFRAAIRLNPDFADAHYSLGITYRKLGRNDDAAREFQTTLRLNPDHQGARKNLESIMGVRK